MKWLKTMTIGEAGVDKDVPFVLHVRCQNGHDEVEETALKVLDVDRDEVEEALPDDQVEAAEVDNDEPLVEDRVVVDADEAVLVEVVRLETTRLGTSLRPTQTAIEDNAEDEVAEVLQPTRQRSRVAQRPSSATMQTGYTRSDGANTPEY